MKRSIFSDGQIALIMQQAEEGVSVGEIFRRLGISIQTYLLEVGGAHAFRNEALTPIGGRKSAPEKDRG